MESKIYIAFFLLCVAWYVYAAVDCRQTGAGRFADPADDRCKNYTLCIYVKSTDNYLAYNTVCPSISLFNPQISRCTSPANFVCNKTYRATDTELTSSAICTYDGYIADPEPTNCKTYIQCVKIKGAFTQLRHSCPGGTFFNPNSTLCESNYQCTEFRCSAPGRIADRYDHTCRHYYYCVQLYNGTYAQFKYSCPIDSVFDPVTKLCTTHYVCT